jgi:hypothetical protein
MIDGDIGNINIMGRLLDLERFPLDDLANAPGRALVARCRQELADRGTFSLAEFVRPQALAQAIAEVQPVFQTAAYPHKRSHNVYFKDTVDGLPADHPALRRFETASHTICADQIPDSVVCRIYDWPPLVAFLAATMGKPRLYPMADPLARANVMAYSEGESINWHFDRSEFTTTLLLQPAEAGGEFQYRSGLRAEDDPNYDGVGRFLADPSREVQSLPQQPGTFTVFKGKYAAHSVTPVEGARTRIVAVYSYYERPGVLFSAEERLGFYGRAEALGSDT